MLPVSGATWPIFTSSVCAHNGKAAPSAATSSVMRRWTVFIGLLLMGRISYLRPFAVDHRGEGYFCDRIHFTSARMSASGTEALGGIGTWPQTPVPPFFTFSKSRAAAPLSLRYFAATSL